ncbi:MAG: hypothetical protein JSS66_07710 [Armatimonadetes bacterium]|nr:hypothetical protein [Armatimonadota bacterium]
MQSITLAKALQVKNRLAEKISQTEATVRNNNSRVVLSGHGSSTSDDIDVEATFKEYVDLQARMVDLKDRISEANRPVQGTIFELAELKGRLVFLKTLNTKHGHEVAPGYHMYSEDGNVKTVEYSATLRKAFVDEQVRLLTNEIDDKQGTLDAHNHKVTIEFDLSWM